jgi:hypothetical protein
MRINGEKMSLYYLGFVMLVALVLVAVMLIRAAMG